MAFVLFLMSVMCNVQFSLLQIVVDTDYLFNVVDEDFLSVTIDISIIKGNFSGVNFNSNSPLITLSKELTPMFVRVGGTSGDFLIFNDFDDPQEPNRLQHSDFSMTTQQFDTLMNFVISSGWNIIFGLNQLLRYPDDQWDSSNAELLIDYCEEKGYKVAWELGNEPDCYLEDHFTSILNGTQGAEGMKALRNILNKKKYSNTLLAGPDVAVLTRVDYLSQYLSAIGETINATTWHHYYGEGAVTILQDFYSIKKLDSLLDHINELLQICNNASFKGDLWIGETSSTYGGGTALFSSSYVSGFMWLDKLGLSAYSHKKVFRQDLIGAKYSLIGDEDYPYPDYWLSLLYKKLVGTKVLNVHGALDYGRGIRVYAHCAKAPYSNGSVVLIVLNVYNESIMVTLKNKEFTESSQDIFWLTPYPRTNITSRIVALNDNPVYMEKNWTIPPLLTQVKKAPPSQFISVQYLSFGFIVFKNANITACM